MAPSRSRNLLLYGFIALCTIAGVHGIISEEGRPDNELFVLCDDKVLNMTCNGTNNDQITWSYDGNTVILPTCMGVEFPFEGRFDSTGSSHHCDLQAEMAEARGTTNIRKLAGPYGCTDFQSLGVTHTALTVELDAWCGMLNQCMLMEGDTVDIGCYAQFDWLSFLLQYNPIVIFNATVWFSDTPASNFTQPQIPPRPGGGFVRGPPSEFLSIRHTYTNVTAGQWINTTCNVRFDFSLSTAYSGRNTYAENSLAWHKCKIEQRVNYCPRGARIDPPYACQAYKVLECIADSWPDASYYWIDHVNGDRRTDGKYFTLQPGPYDLTCVAYLRVNCVMSNSGVYPVCYENGSMAVLRFPGDTEFPYRQWGFPKPTDRSMDCNDTAHISGYAIACPNMTLEAVNGSKCDNNSEVVIFKPSVVEFNCSYESPPPSVTNYTWYLNGNPVRGFNGSRAYISIPSGTRHKVTCAAFIDISSATSQTFGQLGNNTENCTCVDEKDIYVTVIECTDPDIQPKRYCVPENTQFGCFQSSGNQQPPNYFWREDANAMTTPGQYYNVSGIGIKSLQCTARYSHMYCPQYYADCYTNHTVRTFKCPDITLNTTEKMCAVNNEVVLFQPKFVQFECNYENPPSATTYQWYLNNVLLSGAGFTGRTAMIDIPSGNHTVTCRGMIDEGESCVCDENTTLSVTVIECTNPTIEPLRACVPEHTTFTCSETMGNHPPPEYNWQVIGSAGTHPGQQYSVAGIGFFNLMCSVKYTHSYCPECWATCYANHTVKTFKCPNITLGTNEKVCSMNNEVVLFEPKPVTFNCTYESQLSTTTSYSWFLNGLPVNGMTDKMATINIPSGSSTVECRGHINEGDGCDCDGRTTMDVTVVECDDPKFFPTDKCIRKPTNFTCMETTGHPGPPSFEVGYMPDGGMGVTRMHPSYFISDLVDYNLTCQVNYTHPFCPECWAACYTSYRGKVFECPENISLHHNETSIIPGPMGDKNLYFNYTTPIGFECVFETIYYPITKFYWYVNGQQLVDEKDKWFNYYFDRGFHTVTCFAEYAIPDCHPCNQSASVNVTIDVPPITYTHCPYPHWPPVLPPVAAILLSILMVYCYCRCCGPWTGDYWAERREALVMEQHQTEAFRRRLHPSARPYASNNGYNGAARFRGNQITITSGSGGGTVVNC